MDLCGVRILVTRPKDQAGALARLIEAAGGIALCAPMIRILPPENWESCDEQIGRLHDLTDILFSSVNGVEFFLRHLAEMGIDRTKLGSMAVFAVGAKTASALQKSGVQPFFVPATFGGEGLASHFRSQDLKGHRFLLPRGDLGREESAEGLRQAGAVVIPVVVYRTAGPDDISAAFVRTALASRSVDVAVFASPSAVEHFVRILDPGLREAAKEYLVVAAIGETTAAAVRRAGFPAPVVARTATDEGLIEALMSWDRSAQQHAKW